MVGGTTRPIIADSRAEAQPTAHRPSCRSLATGVSMVVRSLMGLVAEYP